jgi:serine/threonine protein kinase
VTKALQPDDLIAHYRVIRALGAGGMGDVYLARGHPHIITVYEIGCEPVRSANGTTRPELVNYIAMELVAGDTLGEITGLK